jgi:hypothetical protein
MIPFKFYAAPNVDTSTTSVPLCIDIPLTALKTIIGIENMAFDRQSVTNSISFVTTGKVVAVQPISNTSLFYFSKLLRNSGSSKHPTCFMNSTFDMTSKVKALEAALTLTGADDSANAEKRDSNFATCCLMKGASS